jgi:alkylhydroperoxidase/carboxymuconolactone decarboxylase family protein YurZ
MPQAAKRLESIEAMARKFRQVTPGLSGHYEELTAEVYKNGELDSRTKRLMAMVGAIVSKCEGCILFQLKTALESGATTGEVLEACGVALSLGGTMGSAEIAKVMEYLVEEGLIEE